MNIKHVSFFALLGCVAFAGDGFAGRSSMYSSINMRNSDGGTININRSASSEDGYAGRRYNRGYEHRSYEQRGAVSRSGAYDNRGDTRYYEEESEPEPEYVSKRTYNQGKTHRKSVRRKYFIANPFYQPLQGQFGSVTTGEYMQGNYKFADIDRKLTELSIKEDLSYGLTDNISLQLMGKYNKDKLTWTNSLDARDEYKSSGLNLYGLGLQGRLVDNNRWISTLSGYYEHQKHGVDYYIADIKAGYKLSSTATTIYGLARGWIVDMEGDVYGDYMDNHSTNEWALIIYGDSTDTLYMGELGAGVWSVLDEDWTLNIEGIYGFYDWHNQLSIKGAFGWQPNDYFALNLYAKTSLYDTANDKHLDLVAESLPLDQTNWAAAWGTPWNPITGHGHALVDLSKYREWSVGVQVMFQF